MDPCAFLRERSRSDPPSKDASASEPEGSGTALMLWLTKPLPPAAARSASLKR